MHAGAPDVDEFLTMLDPIFGAVEIMVEQIGPVVGVHGGPRVIAVGWVERAS